MKLGVKTVLDFEALSPPPFCGRSFRFADGVGVGSAIAAPGVAAGFGLAGRTFRFVDWPYDPAASVMRHKSIVRVDLIDWKLNRNPAKAL